MLSFILSGANITFLDWKLRWKTYNTQKTFLITRRIELVEKKKFVITVLDLEHKIFIVHIASFSSIPLDADVHFSYKSQMAGLIAKKSFIKILAKYANFADIFFLDLISKLLKHTRINNYAIKLVDGQQPSYGVIYSLKLVELEILKTYIEINLANKFIKLFKLSVGALIFFDRKSNGFFWLCINYRGFNNLTIKNWYLLSLVGELLNRLRRARQFSQLDFTNAYH